MLYVEVLVPAGLLDADARTDLARRLSARSLLAGSGTGVVSTDPGVLDLFSALSHVVVREPDLWFADGTAVTASDGPRFVVNVYAGAWAKEMSAHLITAITAELAELAGDRLYAEPRAVVHVIGVTEGGYGVSGTAHTSAGLLEMIENARTRDPGEAPPGMYIDPTCGAAVAASDAVTTELDGVTYGFCCPEPSGRPGYARGRVSAVRVGQGEFRAGRIPGPPGRAPQVRGRPSRRVFRLRSRAVGGWSGWGRVPGVR